MHLIRVAERLGASSRRPRHPRAIDDEELFIIEGSPGAQRPDGRSAKNGLKKVKKPLIAAITAIEEVTDRTATTLSMNCTCGISAVFCTVTTSTCCCTPTGMQQPCPRTGGSQRFSQGSATVGAACLLHNRHRRNLYDLHNKDIDHLVNELQLRNLYGLQNRRNHGICLCATTGI